MIPAYTFRLNWMYRTPRSLRGARARLSQRIFVAWMSQRDGRDAPPGVTHQHRCEDV